MGLCAGTAAMNADAGLESGFACRWGFGMGFGRNFAKKQFFPKTQRELLQEQKDRLQKRLEMVDRALEDI
jgi:hypothetical protein